VRVLLTSTSGSGHFQPLVPLIRAFRDRGDDVMVVAPAALARTLEATGVEYRLGDEPTSEDATRVWSQFSSLERRDAARLVEREWFARLCLEAMLPAVEAAIREWSPDLVVRETCEYAAAVAADAASLRHAQVGISTAAAESRVLRGLVAPTLDERRMGLADRVFHAPYLTKFPASLDPSPFPTTLRYRERDDVAARPLPDWWPDSDAPLVYLTLGTMAMRLGAGPSLLRAMLEALGDLDVRILVTTGPSTRPEELGPVAKNVHVEAWVDQVDVLDVAALVICHGGSGTVFGALAAGVPLIAAPMFADQPTNARLVVDAGAGVALAEGGGSAEENTRALFEHLPRLGALVEDVLGDQRFTLAAHALAVELRSADSPATLARRLGSVDLELTDDSPR
jgi:UDP:flavonoid glycosyltransferase YjiC (YdhE family)